MGFTSSMKAYFLSLNLNGFANWMDVQVQEEHAHAMGMFDYVIDIDTNECINGSNSDKIDYEFELRFEKRGNGSDKNNQFVMSKKSCINDMVSKIDKMENS